MEPYLREEDKVYMNNRRIDEIHQLLLGKQAYGESAAAVKWEKRQPKIKLDAILMRRPDPKYWSHKHMCTRRPLMDTLWPVFQRNLRPTMIVIVEGKEFHCHNLVLRAISLFFRGLEFTEAIDLPSPMVRSRAFVSIYRWAIEPCKVMESGHFMDVHRAAQFLRCDHLVASLWQVIDRECQMYPDKCVSLYKIARSRCTAVEKAIFERLGPCFLPIAASSEFLQMKVETVTRLLCMDTVAVNTEMEVLMAAIMWLDYQWPKRQSEIVNVMGCVRFELIPFLDLLTLVRRTEGPPVLREALTNMEIQDRIKRALDKVFCMPKKYHGRCFDELSRLWAFDPCCSYHHTSKCTAVRYLTYNLFVRYLKWLQKAPTPHFMRMKFGNNLEVLCCPPKSYDRNNRRKNSRGK
ncbi:kelch-like protein 40b [Drosophila tropicalis]|uniref:kelch-like protein 40b n=1 Tax=Drosophila tropicalis TaxID=46794 RepID=UPI0035ABA1F5